MSGIRVYWDAPFGGALIDCDSWLEARCVCSDVVEFEGAAWSDHAHVPVLEGLGYSQVARENLCNVPHDLDGGFVWEIWTPDEDVDWVWDPRAIGVIIRQLGGGPRGNYKATEIVGWLDDYNGPFDAQVSYSVRDASGFRQPSLSEWTSQDFTAWRFLAQNEDGRWTQEDAGGLTRGLDASGEPVEVRAFARDPGGRLVEVLADCYADPRGTGEGLCEFEQRWERARVPVDRRYVEDTDGDLRLCENERDENQLALELALQDSPHERSWPILRSGLGLWFDAERVGELPALLISHEECRNFIQDYCADDVDDDAADRLEAIDYEHLHTTDSPTRVELIPGVWVEHDYVDALIYGVSEEVTGGASFNTVADD